MGAEVFYNVYRWYQPTIGLYSRPDPLGLLPPSDDAVNLLVYVNSRPISYYDPLGLDAFTSDPGVQDCMYCVFRRSGSGFREFEEGFWLVCDGESLSCDIWPSTRRQGTTSRTTTTSSPRPPGACAIFHTHPRSKGPEPSTCEGCDVDQAKQQRLPIYVIFPDGIWKYDPSTDQVTQEEGTDWWKGPKERCKKPCEGLD